MTFYAPYKSGYLLRIKLAPNANGCGLRGVWQSADNTDYLKIAVNAVPEKGKANKELIKFLAKQLKLPTGNIEIISGATDHLKKLYLNTPPTEEKNALIAALGQGE
ncbi:MAG: DUF167 domain-containing protein [Alphaproteobacteria bacterium]|nr:DUF167 domain-containing protein [Alphaproteobacteria bacterium]